MKLLIIFILLTGLIYALDYNPLVVVGGGYISNGTIDANVYITRNIYHNASSFCGNEIIEYGEVCDGTNLGAITTCTAYSPGLVGGTLACSNTCSYDISGCVSPVPGGGGGGGGGGAIINNCENNTYITYKCKCGPLIVEYGYCINGQYNATISHETESTQQALLELLKSINFNKTVFSSANFIVPENTKSSVFYIPIIIGVFTFMILIFMIVRRKDNQKE